MLHLRLGAVLTESTITSTKPESSQIRTKTTSYPPNEPTVTSSQPQSLQITTKTISSVKVTTAQPSMF